MWAVALRAVPAPLWRLAFPLLAPTLGRMGVRAMEQLAMLILAEALKALRGTEQYKQFIQNAAKAVKQTLPGTAVEPVFGDMFIDLGNALKTP